MNQPAVSGPEGAPCAGGQRREIGSLRSIVAIAVWRRTGKRWTLHKPMDVIPVLDLRNGQAVHAIAGQRDRYECVRGSLGTGDDPVALGQAMCRAVRSRQLYVADLDAILRTGNNDAVVRALVASGLEIWLDRGIRTWQDVLAARATGAPCIVLGLETIPTAPTVAGWLDRLRETSPACDMLLSADLIGGTPVDNEFSGSRDIDTIVAEARAIGLNRVLLLDLATVGTERGPSVLEPGTRLRIRWPDLWLAGGGGVRGLEDLLAARAAGFNAFLVGTILHRGKLKPQALQWT